MRASQAPTMRAVRAAAGIHRTVELNIFDRVGADRNAAGRTTVRSQIDAGPAAAQDDSVSPRSAEYLG